MNAISKAITELKYRIPMELLKAAFAPPAESNWRYAPIGLDEHIRQKVIVPRVLVDCNLVGGQLAMIPLQGLPVSYADQYVVVYVIPPERTQNRGILSVLSVTYLPNMVIAGGAGAQYGYTQTGSTSPITIASQRLMDSYSEVPYVSTGYVDLVGENTVMLRDSYQTTQAYYLRCLLGNEANLGNINPRSYPAFARLCELAVRSYIYVTLIVKIDQAYLQGGQELGIFKQLVDSMADAEELYQTYLRETWSTVAFINDLASHDRHIKLQLNSAL